MKYTILSRGRAAGPFTAGGVSSAVPPEKQGARMPDRRFVKISLLLALIALALVPATVNAQSFNGSVSGTVADPSGSAATKENREGSRSAKDAVEDLADAETVEDRKGSDDQQPPGHQNISGEKDPSNTEDSDGEHPISDQRERRSPALVGRNRWHHVIAGLT